MKTLRVLDVWVGAQRLLLPIVQVLAVYPPGGKPPLRGTDRLVLRLDAALQRHIATGDGQTQAVVEPRTGPLWAVDAVGELLDVRPEQLYRLPGLLTGFGAPGVWALARLPEGDFPTLDLNILAQTVLSDYVAA